MLCPGGLAEARVDWQVEILDDVGVEELTGLAAAMIGAVVISPATESAKEAPAPEPVPAS